MRGFFIWSLWYDDHLTKRGQAGGNFGERHSSIILPASISIGGHGNQDFWFDLGETLQHTFA